MYDIKTIKVALKLLKKYDYKFIKVSRELGIRINTLRLWRKKELNNLPLVNNKRNKPSKWSNEHKKKLLDYYFNHGENLMIVFRKFGEPSYSTIKRWVRLDKRYKQKHFVKEYNINISEKVIIRLMREENSIVYVLVSKKKYSSYEGEISPEVQNIVARDFSSTRPHEKTLTDISEFGLYDGKVYLTPLIDCYNGLPITWTIGKSPNSNLTNTMLEQAKLIIGDKPTIIHSDRGFHYRIPSWIERMESYGFIRSMSKKGCSPDNSMCEGFFGTIKNEFFYSKDWSKTKCDDFIVELDKYIYWFKNKRIKNKLLILESN